MLEFGDRETAVLEELVGPELVEQLPHVLPVDDAHHRSRCRTHAPYIAAEFAGLVRGRICYQGQDFLAEGFVPAGGFFEIFDFPENVSEVVHDRGLSGVRGVCQARKLP